MQYEFIKLQVTGVAETRIIDDIPVYGVPLVIWTGIVKQTYEGFQNTDEAFCPLEKAETIDQNEIIAENFAIAFVAQKYPETSDI